MGNYTCISPCLVPLTFSFASRLLHRIVSCLRRQWTVQQATCCPFLPTFLYRLKGRHLQRRSKGPCPHRYKVGRVSSHKRYPRLLNQLLVHENCMALQKCSKQRFTARPASVRGSLFEMILAERSSKNWLTMISSLIAVLPAPIRDASRQMENSSAHLAERGSWIRQR